MLGERGDLSIGTNTALTGVVTLIGLPVWGLIEGNWGLVGGGLAGGLFLLGVAYLLLRTERPPRLPS